MSDKILFEEFYKQTGIKINVVQAKANELIKRLESEGKNTKADLFIAADAGNLEQARGLGLFGSVSSKEIEKLSPKHLRGKDNTWFAISKRARIIVYSKDRVKDGQIKDYEDLVKPEYKGKVLIRSSSNIYNQSLLASMIESLGSKKAREWAKGMVDNFARDPKGSDRDQLKAIYAGVGDVAVLNSYYVGLLLNSKNQEDVNAGNSVGIIFPNQDNRGTHINVSAVGVIKYSKNRENAIKFIEFLLSKPAQEILSKNNYEYPVNVDVEPSETLKKWGKFKEEVLDFSAYGKNQKEAMIIFDEVNWK